MSGQILAAGSIFSSGKELAFYAIGFLAVVALLVGTVHSIRVHSREGAGSGITAQIGTIIFAVLVALSVGIAALVTHEFNSHGIANTVNVDNPWGR
jgi:hypothetical protein